VTSAAVGSVRTRLQAQSELGVSDVFLKSWHYFAKRWLVYSGISLVAYLISSTIQRDLFVWLAHQWNAPSPNELPEVALSVFAIVIAAIALIVLPGLISLTVSAIIYVGLSEDAAAEYSAAAKPISGALGRLPALLAAGIVLGLAIVPLFVLLIVPAIIAGCAYAVVLQVCMVEDLGPIESMERSYRLTKGYRWRIFLLTCVSALIALAMILPIGAMASWLDGVEWGPTLVLIANCLANSFYTSFFIVTSYILYFQLRSLQAPEAEPSAVTAIRRTPALSFLTSEEA